MQHVGILTLSNRQRTATFNSGEHLNLGRTFLIKRPLATPSTPLPTPEKGQQPSTVQRNSSYLMMAIWKFRFQRDITYYIAVEHNYESYFKLLQIEETKECLYQIPL